MTSLSLKQMTSLTKWPWLGFAMWPTLRVDFPFLKCENCHRTLADPISSLVDFSDLKLVLETLFFRLFSTKTVGVWEWTSFGLSWLCSTSQFSAPIVSDCIQVCSPFAIKLYSFQQVSWVSAERRFLPSDRPVKVSMSFARQNESSSSPAKSLRILKISKSLVDSCQTFKVPSRFNLQNCFKIHVNLSRLFQNSLSKL